MRGRPPPAELLGFLGLLLTLGQDLGVFGGPLTVLLPPPALEGDAPALPLQHDRRHQALDLGRLGLSGLAFLGRQRSLDHVLANVVSFAQVEQLPDLGGALGAQTPGDGVVGQSGDLLFALLDDGHGQHGQVLVDDATAHRLALPFARAALTVARVALGQQQTDAAFGHDALLHGETLLVVSAGDAKDVSLPFVTQAFGANFLAHALLVEWTNLHENRPLALEMTPRSLKTALPCVHR